VPTSVGHAPETPSSYLEGMYAKVPFFLSSLGFGSLYSISVDRSRRVISSVECSQYVCSIFSSSH
jgi:hypothetical protein